MQTQKELSLARSLEQTFDGIDHVVEARVHVSLPIASLSIDEVISSRPTASVLIRYDGTNVPVGSHDVANLVAGAVQGLRVEDISVVTVPQDHPEHTGPSLVRAASFDVGSHHAMRLWIVLSTLFIALFGSVGVIVYLLWDRARRADKKS